MIITLTTKTSYDLSQASKFNNFRSNVNRMLQSNSRNSELSHILQQLKKNEPLEKKIDALKQKIQAHLTQKENKANQPQLLKAPAIKVEKSKLPQWQKTGENEFQKIYARLLEDGAQFHGDFNLMVAYSAHIINLFMHMATVTPHQNHAASQKREYDTGFCLQYGRSQGKHPNAKLYRQLAGFGVKNRLPFNSVFTKMLKDVDPNGFAVISQFDAKTGEPKQGKKPGSYANLAIGHAGLRRNNLSILMKGLELAGKKSTQTLLKKLATILPPTKKSFKKTVNFSTLMQTYRQGFGKLTLPSKDNGIGSKIMAYRFRRVKELEAKIEQLGLEKISTQKTQKNTACLFLKLYPGFNPTSASIKEGVTNTLIAVFSGILQQKLEAKNINLRAERRQSFGFLRPTLTDAGSLTIRLSLGLEPTIFDNVIIDSLKALDKVLKTLDFEKQTHPVVKKCLSIKNHDPKKKGQYTFMQSAVSSDRKTLLTFNQAQNYIIKYTKKHSIEKAVELFLSNFILKDTKLPRTNSSKTNAQVNTKPKEVLGLLQNVVLYARNMALSVPYAQSHDFQHTYLHAYKKLFKNVSEAIDLLNRQDAIPGDELFHQATRYLENIIEYGLVLNAFNHAELVKKNPSYDPVEILKNTERSYCSQQLSISQSRMHIFFTDSGQQSINLPMLVYGHMYKQHDHDKACIHLFGETYFEISAFFDDIKQDNVPLTTTENTKARILVVDVTQLDCLKAEIFPKLATCIIDLTHRPDLNNPVLKNQVTLLLQKGITVILSCSLLKHEQLGQDKFQSGRFFVLSPKDDKLAMSKETLDEFQGVSDEAMNPYMASAFNMFNDISDVKPKPSSSILSQTGIFAQRAFNTNFNTQKRSAKPQPD